MKNKEDSIVKALQAIGLHEKEIRLYLEMLTIGDQPASVLSRKLGLPRSSVQFLAETLTKKGIARKHRSRNVTNYQPVPPENLFRILETKKNEILSEYSEKERLLSEAIPELQKIKHQEASRPQVGFFEGSEGLKMVYEDTLFATEPIRTLTSFENRNEHLPGYFEHYYPRRRKNKIFVRAIYPDTNFGKLRQARDIEDFRDSRLVDNTKYKWIPELMFYDNKVSIASGSERIGVIIESQEIADAMKVLFDLAWEGLSRRKNGEE